MAEYGDNSAPNSSASYDTIKSDFLNCLRGELGSVETEVSKRNTRIADRDGYIYGDKLTENIDIPLGHDFTPVNWLKRTVEIHKTQFMGRPFQIISGYDTKDVSTAQDDNEKQQIQMLNKKQKALAELRKKTIDDIIRDNGGHALFADGAESASAVGDFIIKMYFDEDAKKLVLAPIESVENCWALWSQDDFRQYDAFAFVNQISKQRAMDLYGVSADIATSPAGKPLDTITTGQLTAVTTGAVTTATTKGDGTGLTRPMVTVLELTGKVPGYASDNSRLKKVKPGNETELNVVFVGDKLVRLIDDPKKLPRYYIYPNRKARRRAWGLSDITESAININATYIETLSDWRTVQMKVNFPKFRGFNFGPDTTMPKMANRKVQFLPLGEGQDVQVLQQGDANGLEFEKMLDELKEQFVRETGISRVLFDDPSITLNSNQALLTSMKPTSDIAENKKQLWAPILARMFTDALELVSRHLPELKDLSADSYFLKVQWPSVMQKEDPIYQQMLLNRWNAKTISLQSYLEAQGESNEEVDRLRDEMTDPLVAAIHAGQLASTYAINFMPPPSTQPPKVNVSLKGELSPDQEANLAYMHGFNGGDGQPYPTTAGPQGTEGDRAITHANNANNLAGTFPNQTPVQTGPNGAPVSTPANNTPGAGAVSQPGSGAPAVSPQGAINQTNQNNGR
jgi:hypothetical protein